MIAKQVIMTRQKGSQGGKTFGRLLTYISNRDEQQRGPLLLSDNVYSGETAALEMESAALMSPTTKQPAMHIVLSWQKGEHPSVEQQREAITIVLNMLARDGRSMVNHQWAAVLHKDTNNDHLHLVINRVHPDTGRTVTPEWSHRSLEKAIRAIEAKQGWKIDNGFESSKHLPVRAAEMEAHQNVESLVSYIKDHRIEQELKSVLQYDKSTWADVHQVVARFGLSLHKAEKGGFTVSSGEIHIKASNALRSVFSGKEPRARLERLGEWQAHQGGDIADKRYNIHNEPRRNNATVRAEQREARANARQNLWERYQVAKTEHRRLNPLLPKNVIRDQFKSIREAASADRQKIRRQTAPHSRERLIGLSIAAFKVLEQRERIKMELQQHRIAARSPSYQEWVAIMADQGDRAAQSQMRGWRYARSKLTEAQRQNLESSDGRAPTINAGLTNGVTWQRQWLRKGVVYKIDGQAVLIDRGTNIKILRGKDASDQAVALTMSLIAQKQGGRVDMRGNQAFKDRCIAVAVQHRLAISFYDEKMQAAFEAAQPPVSTKDTLRPSIEAIVATQRQNAALLRQERNGLSYER